LQGAYARPATWDVTTEQRRTDAFPSVYYGEAQYFNGCKISLIARAIAIGFIRSTRFGSDEVREPLTRLLHRRDFLHKGVNVVSSDGVRIVAKRRAILVDRSRHQCSEMKNAQRQIEPNR
jgi:hypothetical protein